MKTSDSVVCFHFGFAFRELWNGGLEQPGRGKAAKAERKGWKGDDGGEKWGEGVKEGLGEAENE